MLLRPSRQSGMSVCVCLPMCVLACHGEWETTGQRQERKSYLLHYSMCCTSEHMYLSACVCHRCARLCLSFWTRVYPEFDGSHAACHCTSVFQTPLRLLPCSINNSLCHKPNLTSPRPASEQHQYSIWLPQGGFCVIVSQGDGWRLLRASQYPIWAPLSWFKIQQHSGDTLRSKPL